MRKTGDEWQPDSTRTEHARVTALDQLDQPEPPIGPDCTVGKHPACDGRAWDDTLDNITDCACGCHEEEA